MACVRKSGGPTCLCLIIKVYTTGRIFLLIHIRSASKTSSLIIRPLPFCFHNVDSQPSLDVPSCSDAFLEQEPLEHEEILQDCEGAKTNR